ncbi:YkgJ family cysteine cluster protein [Nanoarchaeota archaeon]
MKIKKSTTKDEVLSLNRPCFECTKCCEHDAGYLADEDHKEMAKFLDISEEELKDKYLQEGTRFNTTRHKPKTIKIKNKPFGKCVFLNEKGCVIHNVKPLHCRIGHCHQFSQQLTDWFNLNFFVNENDPESIRQWALYLENHNCIDGGKLSDLIKDKEKLKKILNYEKLDEK